MRGSPETDSLLIKPIDQYRQLYERAKAWQGGCSIDLNVSEYVPAAVRAHEEGIKYLANFSVQLPSPRDQAESLPDSRQENVIAISKKDMDDFRSVIAGLAEIEAELKKYRIGSQPAVNSLSKLPEFLGGDTAIDFSKHALKASYDKLHEAVYAQAPGEKVTPTLCCRAVCGAICGTALCAASTLTGLFGIACMIGGSTPSASSISTPQDNCLTNLCCFCCSGTGFASYPTYYSYCDKQAPERNVPGVIGAFFSCKESAYHDKPAPVTLDRTRTIDYM